MGSDVIIGHDSNPRCSWAGDRDTALSRYHDEVWGTRTHDESALFEALTLGVFQVGLSWSIVFAKRDAFRKASRFANTIDQLSPTWKTPRVSASNSADSSWVRVPQTSSWYRLRAVSRSPAQEQRGLLSWPMITSLPIRQGKDDRP